MELILLISAVILLAVVLVLQLVLLFRKPRTDGSAERIRESEQRLRDEVRATRQELSGLLTTMNGTLTDGQKQSLQAAAEAQERLRTTLTEAVKSLQDSNEKKLEQMRATVDEKLQKTLGERLDSSFKSVGEQLQNVYKSLGEMKELSEGVQGLQRVLTNVKARGTWAEVQLGNILEQTLTREQYAENVSVRNNGQRVEYAVRIPSREEDGTYIWLPIDSKFPQEDYLRLCDAAERADRDGVEAAGKALEATVRGEAKTISDLYIEVPKTTNFAILFLPTEGLYAEVLRRPGLAEDLQNKYHIMVCGPTTITAFLNTLSMGFRTLAIDRHAADVWKVLGAAKVQYDKFETLLTKARRKIDEAGTALDDAQHRNGMIRRKLDRVEDVDASVADTLLPEPAAWDGSDDSEEN